MVVELASGLFALAGVALTVSLTEMRARREVRAKDSSELTALKRKAYAGALQQVELVAARFAQWTKTESGDHQEAARVFWDALTIAYQIENEIRILARTQEPADAMHRILAVYRAALEGNDRKLPKPREARAGMIQAFRVDLGLPAK